MEELSETFKTVCKIEARFVLVAWAHWSFILSASGRKEGSERRLAKLDFSDGKKFRISRDADFAS